MKFRPQLAEHTVQRKRVTHAELAAAGITPTFENVLDPATWKNALDLQVGDEVEVVGSAFTRTVRVTSLGPAGPTLEHLSGQPLAPVARHLFVCRAAPDTPHMYSLIERRGDAHDFTCQQLMPGQSDLGTLAEEVIRILEQGGELPDVTIGCLDADMVKEGVLSNEDPLLLSWLGKTVLCREGGDALPDRWNSVCYLAGRDHVTGPRMYCGGAASRFHETLLGEKIRAEFASATGEMDWKKFERGRWSELQVRPRWSARVICPGGFPERPKVPDEIERAAARKREELRISMNPAAYREATRAWQQKNLAEFEAASKAKAEGGTQ